MFCTNCGKSTENDQTVCNECLAKLHNAQAAPQPQPATGVTTAKVSTASALAKAITSNVLGSIVIFFAGRMLFGGSLRYGYFGSFLYSLFYAIVLLAPAIVSIVLGGRSRNLAKKCDPHSTPATVFSLTGLIQGIVSTVMAALIPCVTLYWVLLNLFSLL